MAPSSLAVGSRVCFLLPPGRVFHPHSTPGAPPIPFSALVITLKIEEGL